MTPTINWRNNKAKLRGFGRTLLLLGPKKETAVRVVYSDESGIGSEKDEPITIVAALMLNIDSQWHAALELIEEILRTTLGRRDISRYEISGKKLYYKIGRNNPKAATMMSALMAVPGKCRMPIFYGAVDRAGFKFFLQQAFIPTVYKRSGQDRPVLPLDTFQEAMTQCIERVDSYVHTAFPMEQVLWIHDKGRYDDDAKWQLDHVRNLGASEIGALFRYLGKGYLEKSHIVDTIYFGNSEESRALQLADVCCSTIIRHLRGDMDASPYYELLRRQIVNDGSRPEFENAEATWAAMQARTGKKL